MKTEIRSFFDAVRPAIDAALEGLLPSEHTSPFELYRAMRYSVMAGGKRLRPALCIAAYGIYNESFLPIFPFAPPLQMAPTYSPFHDALPAME